MIQSQPKAGMEHDWFWNNRSVCNVCHKSNVMCICKTDNLVMDDALNSRIDNMVYNNQICIERGVDLTELKDY